MWPIPGSLPSFYCTGCGRNNSHILKVYKNQTKQGTQKNLLFIKSTYDAIFFQTLLKITSLKCRPLLMTNSWSRSRKLSMALRVIAGGMAATSCRIVSCNCSIVPGRIFCVPCFVWFILTFKMWAFFLPHPVFGMFLSSKTLCRPHISSFVTWLVQMMFSIPLQYNI